MQRRKTLETLHVEELASEGEKIKDRLQSSKEYFKKNPDFNATLETIDVLLNRVENVRTRLDTLWDKRHKKLEATLKQRKFEDEAHKVGHIRGEREMCKTSYCVSSCVVP